MDYGARNFMMGGPNTFKKKLESGMPIKFPYLRPGLINCTRIWFQIIGIKASKFPNENERFRFINHHLISLLSYYYYNRSFRAHLAFHLAHIFSSHLGYLCIFE